MKTNTLSEKEGICVSISKRVIQKTITQLETILKTSLSVHDFHFLSLHHQGVNLH